MESRRVLAHGRPIVCARIARTARQQHTGLSGIAALPPGTGMAFTFDHKRPSFWMKDTHFPLLIVWIDGAKVIGIDLMPPDTLTLFRPPARITMALELAPADWPGGTSSLVLGSRCPLAG